MLSKFDAQGQQVRMLRKSFISPFSQASKISGWKKKTRPRHHITHSHTSLMHPRQTFIGKKPSPNADKRYCHIVFDYLN
jgi:hypothetical protein